MKRNRPNVLEAYGIRRELHDKYANNYDDYFKRHASEEDRKSVMNNVQELNEEYRQEAAGRVLSSVGTIDRILQERKSKRSGHNF